MSVYSQHNLPRWTEANHNTESQQPMPRPRFERGISRILDYVTRCAKSVDFTE